MGLFNKEEIAGVLNLYKFGKNGDHLANHIMKILSLDAINGLYEKHELIETSLNKIINSNVKCKDCIKEDNINKLRKYKKISK